MRTFFCKLNWHMKWVLLDQHYHREQSGEVETIKSSEIKQCALCGLTAIRESESSYTLTRANTVLTLAQRLETKTE